MIVNIIPIVSSFVINGYFLDKRGKKDFNNKMRILYYVALFLLVVAALLPAPAAVLAAG
jgi:hypothetical protein